MFAKTLFALCTLAAASTASADVIYKVQETFQSGAKFDGTVTFTNDFKDVVATEGLLNGGRYNNEQISWIWWSKTSGEKSVTIDNTTFSNFLMGGNVFLSFTWEIVNGSNIILSNKGYGNTVMYSDPATSGSIAPLNAVPEPASLALFGLGLVGLAARRRRT